jgi:hypothetical protein
MLLQHGIMGQIGQALEASEINVDPTTIFPTSTEMQALLEEILIAAKGTPEDNKLAVANGADLKVLTIGASQTFTIATSNDYMINLTATLNDASAGAGTQEFRGIRLNAVTTNIAGWDSTYLMDLMKDSVSVFQMDLDGNIVMTGSITVPTFSISGAIPELDFYDTDCDDADINAQIYANATTLTTGAEDVDLSMFQQIGGTLLRTYFSDADVGIYLYPKGLTTGVISFTPDITYYKTIANGNPELRIGSDDANEAHFKAMYDSGLQTLDYLLISTDSAGEGDIVLSPASGFVGIIIMHGLVPACCFVCIFWSCFIYGWKFYALRQTSDAVLHSGNVGIGTDCSSL